MKIGFLVNDIKGEYPRYATTLLANEARKRGHQVCYLTVGGFTYRGDQEMVVEARFPPKRKYRNYKEFLAAVKGDEARRRKIAIDELDALMLRNDPAAEIDDRPWAQTAGIVFGQEAARRGVLVLNDPHGLARALNKFYFQLFPAQVRPTTLISRDPEELKAFARAQPEKAVLKPLQGSGGESVFLLRKDDDANVNQIIEAVAAHGYVVAQEYLPAASEGDVRMFLLDGEPLVDKGRYAAFRRRRAEDDMRSNMSVGGQAETAEPTEAQLRIAELVKPRLVEDGMFLVGLDLVGDKLLEVNVFSPGGLYSAQKTQGASFADKIIAAIERRVETGEGVVDAFPDLQLAAV